MDITSYLLGKQAGGGGGQPSLQNKSVTITENGTQNVTADAGYDGLNNVSVTTNVSGGGGLDWSAIGYSGEPQTIIDGYNYAVEIKNNWNATQTNLSSKFRFDYNLVFMPLVDTSNATSVSSMFEECYGLIKVPLLNTSNVTNMNNMFSKCTSLEKVEQFDTSNVTNMGSMFDGCTKLKYIPLLNTTKVTKMSALLRNCKQLTNQSLDNILQMCANVASNYSQTKTLLNITSVQNYEASRIQALPHYQDFLNAGWTIGY